MIETKNLGITNQLKDYQVPLVKNANRYSSILIIIAFFYSIFILFYTPKNIALALILLVPPLLTYVFNYFKLTGLARLSFLLLTSFAIVINHSYLVVDGRDSIFYFLLFQINMFILLWTLFDSREKLLLIIALIFSFLVFLSFFWMNQLVNIQKPIDVLDSMTLQIIMVILNLVLMFRSLYSIQKKYLKSEKELNDSQKKLEEKLAEIKAQDEELETTLAEISATHKEDQKRNWVSNGVAAINNLLRNVDDNIYKNILVGMIEYAKMLYGGIYEIEEDSYGDKYLTLKASFGYDKDKTGSKKISVNEGLLGSVYHESKPTYLIEIPENHSKISSGLGQAIPKSVIVTPMIYEGKTKGLIELASFKKMEDFEQEFVIKVGNLLARFMESYQNEHQTKTLLEKTQQQTEEMRAQEEEMRQNMEELQATQEELHRKEKEYIQKIKKLEEMLGK